MKAHITNNYSQIIKNIEEEHNKEMSAKNIEQKRKRIENGYNTIGSAFGGTIGAQTTEVKGPTGKSQRRINQLDPNKNAKIAITFTEEEIQTTKEEINRKAIIYFNNKIIDEINKPIYKAVILEKLTQAIGIENLTSYDLKITAEVNRKSIEKLNRENKQLWDKYMELDKLPIEGFYKEGKEGIAKPIMGENGKHLIAYLNLSITQTDIDFFKEDNNNLETIVEQRQIKAINEIETQSVRALYGDKFSKENILKEAQEFEETMPKWLRTK